MRWRFIRLRFDAGLRRVFAVAMRRCCAMIAVCFASLRYALALRSTLAEHGFVVETEIAILSEQILLLFYFFDIPAS